MPAAIVAFLFPSLVGTVAGSIVTGVIGLGLAFGLNYLAMSLRKGPKPEDVKGVFRQSAAPRTRHLGRLLTGGYIVFLESARGNLHQITVFGMGPVDEYEKYYIDNVEVTLGTGLDDPAGADWAQEEPFNAKSIYITRRRGLDVQSAFIPLVDRFPDIWTTNHRLNGLACAHVMQHAVEQEEFSKIYKAQVSAITTLARWGNIKDPRTGGLAFSTNHVLHLRDYLTNADGARIAEDMIDDDLFSDAADVCDENITNKAGETIKRYYGAVSYSLDAEPKSVIERILAAFDGRMYLTPEGKIGVLAGKWIAPTVTITDDDIIDFDFSDGDGAFSSANHVVVKFTYADAKYSEATSDPWRDEDNITAFGERSLEILAYEVQNHNQCRRIAKIAQHRSSPRHKGTLITTLKGMECYDQRWIYVVCADLGITEPTPFEILDINLNTEDMTVIISLQSFDGAVAYTFNAATEEGVAPFVPEETERTPIDAPTTVSAHYEERTVGSVTTIDTVYNPSTEENNEVETTTNVTIFVLVASIFAAVNRPDLRPEFRYRLSTEPEGWKSMPVAAGKFEGESGPVEREKTYIVQGRYKGGAGGSSDWTAAAPVTIPGFD